MDRRQRPSVAFQFMIRTSGPSTVSELALSQATVIVDSGRTGSRSRLLAGKNVI
jgi:hypothetical protein